MIEKYKAPTVKKAFQIMGFISKSNQGLRISELSKGLGISKSTVHGITSALEELGAIFRDPVTKRYSLGVTLFELGRLAHTRIDLKDMARPFLEELMLMTQESVFLGVKNRNHVTILDIVESSKDVKITSPIGTRIPLLAGAIGKVFLSSMGKDQALELINENGLTRYTENTAADTDEFIHEVNMARQNGYAMDDEEYISGVRAVASLINGKGTLQSAIWVVGFKPSMEKEKMEFIAHETLKTAQAIGRKIGENEPMVSGGEIDTFRH